MNAVQQKNYDRMVEGARLYALADRSDPFAFSRAMTHIENGICRSTDRGPAIYSADAKQEMRKLDSGFVFSDGSMEYPVTVYHNLTRP